VMSKIVTAHKDVPMQWLEHTGKLFHVGTVPHRAFMVNVSFLVDQIQSGSVVNVH
jgi:hypothetical protein